MYDLLGDRYLEYLENHKSNYYFLNLVIIVQLQNKQLSLQMVQWLYKNNYSFKLASINLNYCSPETIQWHLQNGHICIYEIIDHLNEILHLLYLSNLYNYGKYIEAFCKLIPFFDYLFDNNIYGSIIYNIKMQSFFNFAMNISKNISKKIYLLTCNNLYLDNNTKIWLGIKN